MPGEQVAGLAAEYGISRQDDVQSDFLRLAKRIDPGVWSLSACRSRMVPVSQ